MSKRPEQKLRPSVIFVTQSFQTGYQHLKAYRSISFNLHLFTNQLCPQNLLMLRYIFSQLLLWIFYFVRNPVHAFAFQAAQILSVGCGNSLKVTEVPRFQLMTGNPYQRSSPRPVTQLLQFIL